MTHLFILFNALFFSIFNYFNINTTTKSHHMSLCMDVNQNTTTTALFTQSTEKQAIIPSVFETDPNKTYSMPGLGQTAKGALYMSWTEKDDSGLTAFCMAFSNDAGKSFGEKKIIATGYGIGNNRLMRAKILAKKNGDLVAVFMNNPNATAPAAGGRGSRGGQVSYSISKDGANTWSPAIGVDTDPSPNLMRGFFDATLLANDEIAVAYLKDVKNSTKHEERDLRIAITKNGVFQDEKLLDAVVCDCCNISLLVDDKGLLRVVYRDNNDNIRDFAQMISKDNGQTFSQPVIIQNDGWKINGCPHNGAVAAKFGSSALFSWYSGAETEKGIRLTTAEGKNLEVLTDASAKNQSLIAGTGTQAVLLWEQPAANQGKTQLYYKHIKGSKVSEAKAIEGTLAASNGTALVVGKQLLFAHELKQEGKKMSISVGSFSL